MHSPTDVHATLLKRVLRYIKGTLSLGVQLRGTTSLSLAVYSDADWAGCPDTRHSTSGFCVFLSVALVSWSSKRQSTVSRSSAEAEYGGVANAITECTWLRSLLGELGCPVHSATIVFCDHVSAVYMSSNPVHHKQTKHIERHPLRKREGGPGRSSRSTRAKLTPVCGCVHQRASISSLHRLQKQPLRGQPRRRGVKRMNSRSNGTPRTRSPDAADSLYPALETRSPSHPHSNACRTARSPRLACRAVRVPRSPHSTLISWLA